MDGLVIKNTGSWYIVQTDTGQQYECKIKGNFRIKGIRSTNPVAVGDRVTITPTIEKSDNSGSATAFITDIHDRRNYIARKSINLSKQSHILAANVDRAYLVITLAHPTTSLVFIDRFLATAEAYDVPVTLVINKCDLLGEDDKPYLDGVTALYRSLGYDVIHTCALVENGYDEMVVNPCDLSCLIHEMRNQVSLFAGNSGVGKSTLLQALIPGLKLKTAEISEAHDQGMHTTTFSEMYAVPDGGWVIDTPGVRGFGTFNMEKEEITHYFREIFNTSSDCRFGTGCTHTHEPGCAVLRAVEEHHIAQSRYNSYLSMLQDENEGKYR